MEHYWIQSSSADDLPDFAIEGGYDCDGTPIYVGRAKHEDDLLPAKVIPSKGCAYVSWGGQEISKNYYEVLVGPGYDWCPCENGAVLSNAVSSGVTSNGEPLYIGRGHHANSLSVGKVHPSHSCLYIPFGGQEISVSSYEVLVCENNDKWMPSSLDHTPHDAVVAGYDTDGTAIFVGRSWHEGQFIPAKVVPSRGEAYISCDGLEIKKSEIEILCGYNYDKWMPSSLDHTPHDAVVAGYDTDGTAIFVGRSWHEGQFIPAKVVPSRGEAYISCDGLEIKKSEIEILCGYNYDWINIGSENIPNNAVFTGRFEDGEPLFVGRTHHCESLTPGLVSPGDHCIFIPYGGQEIRKHEFEILVRQ